MQLSRLFTSSLLSFLFTSALAQPSTEVYLLDFRRSSEGVVLENPQNISQNPGYDNQPSFWSDSESILYARNVDGQTEIARYYPESNNTIKISKTKEGSEYSPLQTPDNRISSIRLDTTGLQLLYRYKLNGDHEVLVSDLKIGYHAWVSQDKLVAFVLGEPATLQLIDVKSKNAEILRSNIGRSLHKIPATNSFSFVDKTSSRWQIKSIDIETREEKILTSVVEGAEDYCWTPQGEIVMGKGSKLYLWKPGTTWTEISDLEGKGIGDITRVAISPDGKKLALVSSK